MNANIDVTVAAIAKRDNRFLTVEERVGNSIVFNQPAGHVEAGEALLEAVIRETLEETGFAFEPECVVGIYTWRAPDLTSFLRVCIAGRCSEIPVSRQLDEGIVAAHWLTRDELLSPSRKLRSPLVIPAVDDYEAGQRLPLDLLRHFAPPELKQHG